MEQKLQVNECEKLVIGWKVKIEFEIKQIFQGEGPHSTAQVLLPSPSALTPI